MRINNHGETIIEVLLAVVVASTIMASAFVAVNRSTASARSTQEHSEALQIAESQLELSKGLISDDTQSGVYCVVNDGAGSAQLFSYNASTAALCSGTKVSKGFDGYKTFIDYQKADSGKGGEYTVRVEWEGLTGTDAQVSLSYKSAATSLTPDQVVVTNPTPSPGGLIVPVTILWTSNWCSTPIRSGLSCSYVITFTGGITNGSKPYNGTGNYNYTVDVNNAQTYRYRVFVVIAGLRVGSAFACGNIVNGVAPTLASSQTGSACQ